MKLKKIICVAMVAAMSLTSITAFATVPTPKDNTQAFIYAENYFNQGLYYEAMDELNYVLPIYSHERDKLAMWTHKVQDKITEWEVSEIFRNVKDLYDKNEVVAAYNYLHNNMERYVNWTSAGYANYANVNGYNGSGLNVSGSTVNAAGALVNSLTQSEMEQYKYWVDQLDKGIIDEAKAIVAVEDFVGDILWDPEMYYSVVPFDDGWDVYVKTVDSDHNIAAYHVAKRLVPGQYYFRGERNGDTLLVSTAGTNYAYYTRSGVQTAVDGVFYEERNANVSFTALDYNGNPGSEYEWRYDSVMSETNGFPESVRANAGVWPARNDQSTYVAD